jgi:hypothetical protein
MKADYPASSGSGMNREPMGRLALFTALILFWRD